MRMGVLGGNGDTDLAGDTLVPQDLQEALEDLRATPDEGLDEGNPLPTRLEVYPTPDGEVASPSIHPKRQGLRALGAGVRGVAARLSTS